MIDELDGAGEPTGRSFPRKQIHKRGLWHRTVHVWLLNSSKQLLLQKRSHLKESHPGLWDISAAGHCCSGDTSIYSAVREIQEELGIEVEPGSLEYLFTVTQSFAENDFVDNEFCDVYLLRADVLVGDLSVCTEEVADVRFLFWPKLEKSCGGSEFVDHEQEYAKLFSFLSKTCS